MRQAIALARRAERRPGMAPIGCVIVRDGAILAEGGNEVALRRDPTARAEIVAIRKASERTEGFELRGTKLYSTLQPCGMCTMASVWARVGRIVYGAERHQVHRMSFDVRHMDTIDFIHDAFRADLPVIGGVLGEECAGLYFKPGDVVPEAEQGNI